MRIENLTVQETHFNLIIIGAGAAGLMCAQLSGAKNQRVLIIDHSNKLAEKIRISGGGRCNFTNLYTSLECYLSENPYFATSALSRYTPQDFVALLNQYNINYHEKTLGQLFCDDSSKAIIDLLDFLCRDSGVIRMMGTSVRHINKITSGFELETSRGKFSCENLVIATGGLSIPQIGASGFGYQVAEQFGISLVDTAPALVPLTLHHENLTTFKNLAGVSVFSETSIGKISFQENSLFTHRGLSGPAILQISSYWDPYTYLTINLLPNHNISTEISSFKSSNKLLSNFLAEYFSTRLADSLCKLVGFDKSLSQLSNSNIQLLAQLIHNFKIIPSGSEGYKKAEVTRGGINTKELDSKTMMAKNVNGLYFIGEVVDVTGWLGGYNFQWAWASASAVACSF